MLDPADLVDLFLNLQTLEVVKLRLMTLKRAVHIVVTSEHRGRSHHRLDTLCMRENGDIWTNVLFLVNHIGNGY